MEGLGDARWLLNEGAVEFAMHSFNGPSRRFLALGCFRSPPTSMSYRHRNALYLRISSHTVLPLYLYLDDKHTSWMNDRLLQRIVADMKHLYALKCLVK